MMNNKIWAHRIIEFIFFCYITISFLAIDNFFAISRFNAIGLNNQGNFGISEYIRQFVFIVEYIAAVLTFYYATKLNRKIGIPVLFILWASIFVDTSIHLIKGSPADIYYISAINGAVGNVGDAISQYSSQMLSALVLTSILMLPLLVKAAKPTKPSKNYPFLILLGVLIFFYGFILIARGSPALIGFPKGYAYGFGSLALQANNIYQSVQPDEDLKLKTYSTNSTINKIIVIIDESIEYGEFSKLYQKAIPYSINFGQAYSGANCSAASNYIIRRATWERKGGTTNDNAINIKTTESLFALAKRASFRTLYIDNQHVLKDPTVRNYFDNTEIENIDTIIEPDGAAFTRDLGTITNISSELSKGNSFIFINKYGAHFPYASTIPESSVTSNNKENYRESIRRNAIEYLNEIAKIIDDNTIVFYTSDHGQNLDATATHCNTGTDANIKEYSVPFVIITKNSAVYSQLTNIADRYNNLLTHIEFSESIRNVIGFEVEGKWSVFKSDLPFEKQFCGLYGPPKSFFGVKPKGKPIQH